MDAQFSRAMIVNPRRAHAHSHSASYEFPLDAQNDLIQFIGQALSRGRHCLSCKRPTIRVDLRAELHAEVSLP
jgi:hypothetical protein